MRTQWVIIIAFFFALVTAIFAVINVESVEVNFGFVQTHTPLILVILVSTLLGGLTVFLFAMIRQFKLQRQLRHLQKQLDEYAKAHSEPQPTPEAAATPSDTASTNEEQSST